MRDFHKANDEKGGGGETKNGYITKVLASKDQEVTDLSKETYRVQHDCLLWGLVGWDCSGSDGCTMKIVFGDGGETTVRLAKNFDLHGYGQTTFCLPLVEGSTLSFTLEEKSATAKGKHWVNFVEFEIG